MCYLVALPGSQIPDLDKSSGPGDHGSWRSSDSSKGFLPQICQILVILVKTKANSVLTWDSCLTMENIDEIDRKTDSLIIPS